MGWLLPNAYLVARITPVMVSRMVLSLAKSMAPSRRHRWEMDHFTVESVDSDLSIDLEMDRRQQRSSPGEEEAGMERARDSLIL